MQPWASGPAHGRKELSLSTGASLFSFFSVSDSLGLERELAAFAGWGRGVPLLSRAFAFSLLREPIVPHLCSPWDYLKSNSSEHISTDRSRKKSGKSFSF